MDIKVIKSKLNNDYISIILKFAALAIGVVATFFFTRFYFAEVFNEAFSKKYNLLMALPFIGMLFVVIGFLWLLIRKKEFKYERVYLLCAICFGIGMQIILPPLSGPDENTHFLSAYHGSDVMLFMDEWGPDGQFYFRREETKYPIYHENYPAVYQLIADGNWFGVEEGYEGLVTNAEITVSWYKYPFAAFGIAIARLLNFGVVGLLYSGRIMNMLALIVIGYFCVKLTPYGKAQVTGIAMLPLLVELCCSYSYDTLSNMFSLLFLVLCMYYSVPENKFSFIDLFILTTVYAYVVPNKIVYSAFVPLVLMIPFSKWKDLLKEKTKATVIKSILYVIYFAWVVYADFFRYGRIAGDILNKEEGASIEQTTDRASYTIPYILKHPLEIIDLLLGTVKRYGWTDFKGMIGSNLGSHRTQIPVNEGFIILIIIAIILGLIINRGKWVGQKRFWLYIISALMVGGAIVLGCLLRFTPVEGTDRLQVSPRYLLPVFNLFFIVLGTDKEENKVALSILYIQAIGMIGVLCSALAYTINYVR